MRAIVFFTFFVLSGISYASSISYQERISLIDSSSFTDKQIHQWENELLFPHLYEHWLSKNIQSLTPEQVETFQANPDNKAANWFFKTKWRSELIRRENWQQINKSFSTFSDPSLVCHFFESQKKLGQKIADKKIKALWLSGKSRPDHCDPFFKNWLKSLEDPDPIIWERQIAAFYARNGKLLSYLNRFYKQDTYQELGRFLVEVYSNPKTVISKSYDPNSNEMRNLALAAVNRMAFKDPRSASNLWLQIVKATPGIAQKEVRKASRYLGIAMAKQALPEASYWLTVADPSQADEKVQHWRLQIALSLNDYAGVIDYYKSLSNELKGSNQWRYWYGVARYKTEGKLASDNPLRSLSTKRLYYGYLAAGILGTIPSLNAEPDYPPTHFNRLEEQPELARAKALYLAGKTERAQVEWNLWVKYQDNPTQHAAGELALSWGWYAKASQSAGWSGRYDLMHLRYPNAFGAFVKYHADRLELPEYWVHGVMRQESRFEHTAISPAGAYGLMQIMPNTAKQTAKKHNLNYANKRDLYDPSTNIAIGSHYLDDLMVRFKHPVFATAAYNAGPSRVDLWRNRFPSEMTIWIESIPFDETRNYVKSVLAYSQIYALTTDTEWRLSSWTNPSEAFAQKNE